MKRKKYTITTNNTMTFQSFTEESQPYANI